MINKNSTIVNLIELALIVFFLFLLIWLQHYVVGTNKYLDQHQRFPFIFYIITSLPLIMGFIVRTPSLVVRKMAGHLTVNKPRLIGAIMVGIIFVLVPRLYFIKSLPVFIWQLFVLYPGVSALAALWVGISIADSFESP